LNPGAIGILGVGAIGGSIGLRARREGRPVVGADSNDAVLKEALALGAIDACASVDDVAGGVETYVVAAHLGATLHEIERLTRAAHAEPSLVIDVASVKVPVVRAASRLRNFVATHPMAGTERSGVRAACDDLFDGRTWAYVPSRDEELDRRVRDFIELMGAVPFAISAEDHDRAVALSSHVPQLVASCYAHLVESSDSAASDLCGPVARELLRISGMSFDMWCDILQANAANIEGPLRTLSSDLGQVADALSKNDMENLRALFR
jgi:prephenate dehydrogenase